MVEETGCREDKNMKKRLFAGILSGILLMCGWSAAAEAPDPESCLFYDINDDGSGVVLTYMDGDYETFSIPETMDGMTVTGIGSGVFANKEILGRLYIPVTVQTIAEDAFENSPRICLLVESSSAAEAFAITAGLPYEVESDMRETASSGEAAAVQIPVADADTVNIFSPQAQIMDLQALLCQISLLPTSGVNGVYDIATQNAVRNLQSFVNMQKQDNTLEVTGICDPLTMQYLQYCCGNGLNVGEWFQSASQAIPSHAPESEATPAPTPTAAPRKYNIIQKEDTGAEVASLQECLMAYGYFDGKIDGDFGNMTRDAVRMFQRCNGLRETGIADNETQILLRDGRPVEYSLPRERDFDMRCSASSFGGSEITVSSASESSYLTDKYYNYKANYVLDNDDRHCWAAKGSRQDDIGEWISLNLSGKRIIGGFSIKSGYQMAQKQYFGNYRPMNLGIYADGSYLGEVRIEDRMGVQYVQFSQPILAKTIRFEIRSVYNTNHDKDTCITALRLLTDGN